MNHTDQVVLSVYKFNSLATEAKSCKKLLTRKAYTQTKTRLSESELQQNVKNAFALLRDPVVNQDEIYILIDDVFTTGFTLNTYVNTCATALQEAGAPRLRVATLGHR